MPQFLPFHALRYTRDLNLADVCAPPYDVQTAAQRAELANRHINNIVHLDLPLGDEPYLDAAKRLEQWRNTGVLVVDQSSSFTLYRMSFVDASGKSRQTVGVIGALRIDELDSRQVLPHEQTTPKAKTDRLELTRATKSNLSPIWGLSLTSGLTSALLDPGENLGSMTDEDGVVHSVERINDKERCTVIGELIAQSPVVIADGHHRYAISRTYRDEQRAISRSPGPNDLSQSEAILTYISELVEEQLSVAAIHRLYSGVTYSDLTNVLSKSFEIEPIATISDNIISAMTHTNHLTLVAPDGSGARLTPKQGIFTGVRQLDSALLEHALRSCQHDIAYQHGLNEVREQLATHKYTAAILIRPVSVTEIQRTVNERLLMPPKSTFFTPKLRTGLVMRLLD